MTVYHRPVMTSECLLYLNLQAGGVYVDATLGGGGHTLAMLKREPQIKVYGFDQDADAIKRAGETLKDYQDRVEIIRANFSQLRTELAMRRIKQINGILFDLGVSSHQLDEKQRGFSFDNDAALDMRMNQDASISAREIVNEWSYADLARIFREYGEEHLAGKIAGAIDYHRKQKSIDSTGQLARIIETVAGVGTRESLKTKVRVFQAIRIAVNRELDVIGPTLVDAMNILSPGGRIVVMAYHSLEDRIVKNVFKDAARGCDCPPRAVHCVCGKKPRLRVLTGRPVSAEATEIDENPRSRSAKLRAAEKIMGE